MSYNSNNVGHSVRGGGGVDILTSTGSARGTFVVEVLTPEEDAGVVMRNNYAGGAGGFTADDDTKKQSTATGTIQIDSGTATTDLPQLLDYFEGDFGMGDARYVIHKRSMPQNANQPWTMTVDLLVDHFVPVDP